jgi:hypothetical protein
MSARLRLRAFVSCLALALSLVFALGEGSAFAQAAKPAPNEKAQAAALKRKGDAEMDLLHYAEALASYTEAYQLTHDPALLYNRSRVLEALDRFVEALDELERFAKEAPPDLRARVPKLKELLADLNARVSKLTVNCPTPNARILVRDKVVATTPVPGPIRLNAGTAELEVLAEGYAPFKKSIELPKGGELVVDVALVARDARGQLVIASTPEGADVKVDGRPYGRAPAEAELAPGNHVVVMNLDGFREKTTSVVVVEGERKRVDVSLDAKPPITQTWWFWTGIGVVVVGVTIATFAVALSTERSAGEGDIPPGQVAGPLRF